MIGGNSRRNVGFHIDRRRSGALVQQPLGVGARQRDLAAGDVAERDMANGTARRSVAVRIDHSISDCAQS